MDLGAVVVVGCSFNYGTVVSPSPSSCIRLVRDKATGVEATQALFAAHAYDIQRRRVRGVEDRCAVQEYLGAHALRCSRPAFRMLQIAFAVLLTRSVDPLCSPHVPVRASG